MDLLKEISDPDHETRAEAYDELSLQMNDELAGEVVALATGNAAEPIREHAIVFLGPLIEECGIDYDEALEFRFAPEFGPPITAETFATIIKKIRAIYEDEAQPKLLRRRAFEVLVRDPQPWQRDEISRNLTSDDEDWRLTAIFAMGQMTGFEKELLGLLKTSEGLLLEEAVRSAGQMGLKKAAPGIRKLAESEETPRDLKIEAILALGNVDPDSRDLLGRLSKSSDEDVAAAATQALDELSMLADESDEY